MAYLILISLLFAFLGKVWYKKFSNPLSVFSLLWAVIFFLYSLKLKPYYDINALTQQVLYAQMIGFGMGCFLTNRKARIDSLKEEKVEYVPRMRIIYILCTITVFILLKDTIDVLGYLSEGKTYYDLAADELITENTATGYMVFLKIFVSFPTTFAISVIAATEMFFGKRNFLLLILNIVIVALYALQHGGRNIIIIMFASYFFAYAFSNQHKKISFKSKVFLILFGIGAMYFALWLSRMREIDNMETSLYFYFSCCVPHLNQHLINLSRAGEYTFGFTSLNGFISPFIILFRGIGLMKSTPELYSLANEIIYAVEEVTKIGNGVSTNAFVGPAYTFFADGGILAVLLFSGFYGFFCMKFYHRMNRTKDKKNTAICLLLMTTLVITYLKFNFCQYFYSMALLYILFIFYKRKED